VLVKIIELLKEYSETSLNRPAVGQKNMAGFVRLPLQRIVWQGLKKSFDIQV
jgi:hypothetical protein